MSKIQNETNSQLITKFNVELTKCEYYVKDTKWNQFTTGRMAEFYGKRLSGYLAENSNIYPLWMSGNNKLQDIQSRELGYGTGIYLGRSRRTTTNNERKYYPYCKDC